MKNRLIRGIRLLLFILPVCGYSYIHAQAGRDTLAVFRDFVALSNAYKQVPFYISMEIKSTTNLVVQPDDTLTVSGEFYIRKEGAYVQMSGFEQLIGDSMALLVNNQLRQMVLYRDAAPVISRMKDMMSAAVGDSSLAGWAKRYTASVSDPSGGEAVITLQSREQLPESGLSKETITLRYDPSARLLKEVVTVRRRLLAIDSAQYAELSGRPELSGRLLAPEAGGYFVIREEQQAFVYTEVEPGTQRRLPVLITDRILRTPEGEYRPVKGYEGYRLSLQ